MRCFLDATSKRFKKIQYKEIRCEYCNRIFGILTDVIVDAILSKEGDIKCYGCGSIKKIIKEGKIDVS